MPAAIAPPLASAHRSDERRYPLRYHSHADIRPSASSHHASAHKTKEPIASARSCPKMLKCLLGGICTSSCEGFTHRRRRITHRQRYIFSDVEFPPQRRRCVASGCWASCPMPDTSPQRDQVSIDLAIDVLLTASWNVGFSPVWQRECPRGAPMAHQAALSFPGGASVPHTNDNSARKFPFAPGLAASAGCPAIGAEL